MGATVREVCQWMKQQALGKLRFATPDDFPLVEMYTLLNAYITK
jgi:hypothetical protein